MHLSFHLKLGWVLIHEICVAFANACVLLLVEMSGMVLGCLKSLPSP